MYPFAVTILTLCVSAILSAYVVVKISDTRRGKDWILQSFKTLEIQGKTFIEVVVFHKDFGQKQSVRFLTDMKPEVSGIARGIRFIRDPRKYQFNPQHFVFNFEKGV